MFKTKRIPRHLLLSETDADNHWVRRALMCVLALLVGIGLGILASESSHVRQSGCQATGENRQELAPPPAGSTVTPALANYS